MNSTFDKSAAMAVAKVIRDCGVYAEVTNFGNFPDVWCVRFDLLGTMVIADLAKSFETKYPVKSSTVRY